MRDAEDRSDRQMRAMEDRLMQEVRALERRLTPELTRRSGFMVPCWPLLMNRRTLTRLFIVVVAGAGA